MSQIIEIKVPDIGNFHDVPIIEVCVKAGDSVNAEDALLTLESDKATIDIPAPAAGVIKELKVKIGDKVSEGTLVALIEVAAAGAVVPEVAAPAPTTASAAVATAPSPAPQPGQFSGTADVECEMLVLGAGPGGYSAAFRAADLGIKTVIVERYSTLGGVCLNVGCIPSKALLHVAVVADEAEHMADCGLTFAAPQIDIDKLRAHKAKVVGKLTTGLAAMAKMRKVDIVRGYGDFLDANHIEVELTDGPAQETTGRQEDHPLQELHHRSRQRAGASAVHPARPTHRRFNWCA